MSQPAIYCLRGHSRFTARCYRLSADLMYRYADVDHLIARSGDWQVQTPGGLYFMSAANFVAEFEAVEDATEQAQAEYFLTLLTIRKEPRLDEELMREVWRKHYWDSPRHARRAFIS